MYHQADSSLRWSSAQNALAALNLGRLLLQQGRYSEAQIAMDWAVALTKTLKTIFPNHERYRLAFVAGWNACGNACWIKTWRA